MNCSEMIALISGHLDGANSREEESLLREHLAECTSCRELLKEFQKTDALLKQQEELRSDFCESVMERIKEDTRQRKRKARLWTTIGASAAAVVLVLGAGALTMPKMGSDSAAAEAKAEMEETAEYSVAKVMYDAVEEAAMEAEQPMAAYSVTGASSVIPQEMADQLGCVMVCFDHAVEELSAYAVETTEDGTILYVLADADEAAELGQAYDGIIYFPAEARSELAYAMVMGE